MPLSHGVLAFQLTPRTLSLHDSISLCPIHVHTTLHFSPAQVRRANSGEQASTPRLASPGSCHIHTTTAAPTDSAAAAVPAGTGSVPTRRRLRLQTLIHLPIHLVRSHAVCTDSAAAAAVPAGTHSSFTNTTNTSTDMAAPSADINPSTNTPTDAAVAAVLCLLI